MAPRLACLLVVLCLGACGELDSKPDAALLDGSEELDGGLDRIDAEVPIPMDGSTALVDAALADAGALDAGSVDAGTVDAGSADAGAFDAGSGDGGMFDAGSADGETDAGMPIDAGSLDGGVLDVRVLADRYCADLSFDPPSVAVPAGTSFTIRWINATACTEIDIDMNGTVPIVLRLQPGQSHHDTVREWCGTYTGRYTFRAYYSPSFPYYLDVDCSG